MLNPSFDDTTRRGSPEIDPSLEPSILFTGRCPHSASAKSSCREDSHEINRQNIEQSRTVSSHAVPRAFMSAARQRRRA